MENWKKEFIAELKEKRTTYADMIDFCCDNMVLNNSIIEALAEKGFYFDIYSGEDYNEETDEYNEVFQYFIISANDADRLAEYTNEIVYFNEELEIYLLGVTHFGTMWGGVDANWKSENEIEN